MITALGLKRVNFIEKLYFAWGKPSLFLSKALLAVSLIGEGEAS